MSRVTQSLRASDYPPLVYFYGGAPIPAYANVTLRYMRSRWNGEIVILHSDPVPKKVRGVTYLHYTEWYDSRPFEKFKNGSPLEESFRQGFWYLTAERFFVLAQWANRADVQRFLHAELDVALYDVGDLPEALDSWGDGLFYPRASSEFAGASLMYVNSLSSLADLLSFAGQNASLGYEMRVLAAFNDAHPDRAFALPSHSSIETDLGIQKTWKGLEPSDIGGIVDVGGLGTWMMGNDPRNVRGRPSYNKAIVDGHGSQQFAKLRFRYSARRRALTVRAPASQELEIKALHIHSKEMRIALSPWRLALATGLLRLPWKSPIVMQSLHSEFFRGGRAAVDFFYVRLRRSGLIPKTTPKD
jgi:hypothetical protein